MEPEFVSNSEPTPVATITPPAATTPWIMKMVDDIENKFSSVRGSFSKTRNFKTPKFKIPKLVILLIIGVVVISAIILAVKSSRAQNAQSTASGNGNAKPLAPSAKATQTINKEFSFPIKDDKGAEISKIKYVIETASLQDEILVKGERARAVQGRTFLILNLKITNNYKQGIQISSRDYVRLVVDGKKDELIAADIHNDPVEVQAISTKITRLGFPINETYKNLELQVGEINGKKETININFTK